MNQEHLNIVSNLVKAMYNLQEVYSRVGSEPIYGRDASILGVEDGTCYAPSQDEIDDAKYQASDACEAALEAGLIVELPRIYF